MVLNYVLIAIPVVFFVPLGVVWILFPKRVLQWAGHVFLPLLFWPVVRFYRLLGLEPEPELSRQLAREPTQRDVLIARLMGALSILAALLWLAAALGSFS